MQMEKASSRRRKALRFGTVVGVAAAAVLATASPSWAAEDVATVNPPSGLASTAVPLTLSVATQQPWPTHSSRAPRLWNSSRLEPASRRKPPTRRRRSRPWPPPT